VGVPAPINRADFGLITSVLSSLTILWLSKAACVRLQVQPESYRAMRNAIKLTCST
jgi:hypothetical protein